MITHKNIPFGFEGFYPIIKLHISEHKDAICERLNQLAKSDINGTMPVVEVYDMIAELDYNDTENELRIAIADFIT